VGGGVLGGGVGAGIGLLIGSSQAKQGDWGTPLLGALIGVVVGGEAGMLAGVQYEGDQRGGTGKLWGTLVGGAGGVIVGGFAVYYGTKAKLSYPALLLLGGIFVVGGPIVGYHLSGDAHASAATARVLPIVTLAF
jgi:hypothetical protein